LMKMLNKTGPRTDLWGTLLVTRLVHVCSLGFFFSCQDSISGECNGGLQLSGLVQNTLYGLTYDEEFTRYIFIVAKYLKFRIYYLVILQ